MLSLIGWYYMGVPGCIKEDSLPKEPTLLKDKSQVAQQIVLLILWQHPEDWTPPERRHNGEHGYRMVKNICVVYGKKNPDRTNRNRSTPPIEGVPFKKQSIFFQYQPYWLDLEVPHAIDAMHVQKNVFESLIATLMDIGKSKDGLKARKNMVQLNWCQSFTRYLRLMDNTLCPQLALT